LFWKRHLGFMRSFINPGRGTRDVGRENLEPSNITRIKGIKRILQRQIYWFLILFIPFIPVKLFFGSL